MTQKQITITLNQATNMLGVLQRISAASMPPRYAFIISRNHAALAGNPDVIAAEQTRVALVKEHGKPTDTGYMVPPENLQAFATAFAQVGANVVEIGFLPLSLAALDELPDLAPTDMSVLDPLVDLEA
jgi:hypothetical protein